jgi:hypothetical protein
MCAVLEGQVIMVDPSARGVSLVELTILSAMMAGAVSGAVTGWIARRNPLLSIAAFLIGIFGGMLVGTGMGYLCYGQPDGYNYPPIKSGYSALMSSGLAGLAGSLPTALFVACIIAFMTLRHLHPRPPRVKTALTGFGMGLITGVLTALMMAIV